MIRIGLVPLDSRPCNTTWLEKLSENANCDLKMYPQNKCGTLYKKSYFADIKQWINENVNELDYLILSSDSLCFGGLIQARKALIDLNKVLVDLEFLRDIKNKNKDLKIFVFDTMMRTSITAYNEETAKYWSLINKYSSLVGKYYFFNNEEDKKELEEVEKQIPDHLIITYLNARKNKFSINEYFLSLLNDKVIDYMLLLQEDSMPYGIQKIEQEKLNKFIKEKDLFDRISFTNGTDEGACVLFARALNSIKKKVYVHLMNDDVINKSHLFEDRPFKDNLYKMLDSANFEVTSDKDNNDFILSIYGEKTNKDLDLLKRTPIYPNKNKEYERYISELNNFIDSKKNVCFVDLLFPNGGSIDILKDIHYKDLKAYLAWNTSSNSLGSSLGVMASYLNGKNEILNKKFLYERIVDDCIYQGIVRQEVNEVLVKEKINIYSLDNEYERVLYLVNEKMQKYLYLVDNKRYRIILPWKRMFEIDLWEE